MVGGKIIEITRMRTEGGKDVVRLWCVDKFDECAVYAEPFEVGPKIGDSIWWQSCIIYFDGDRQTLRKVGFSFDPRQA